MNYMDNESHNQALELFEEFKNPNTNMVDSSEFLECINESSVSDNCKLLIKKLQKRKGLKLDQKQFMELFDFDFVTNSENLDIICQRFDEIGNQNGYISTQELKEASRIYNLGLSDQDIQVMIKYGGNKEDIITIDQLKALIIGK
ncbi:hypothetical protein IMG5_103620 [Ichthyophthirius multifiliis]|uniref:EF-hand domain-containing protein n=1 Tax=Ichthyophthirius multifiliis TaxID=5932 RepID=G0QSV1_ICHMU|nr:hypothetical protein IMG5_103620 [Ichthyophthirius multifiliis]EGR31718.1 hypothetical protein IMG5_103620 [Ichthyophthirius multifiliis]|eukprot:XP_004035204.1 hypothetical protein IMG5_103620 [Ichthyophthirius multifiliis]